MKKNRLPIKAAFLLLLFYVTTYATACSTITVNTSYEAGVDFDRYKTYGWMPGVRTTGSLPEIIGAGRVGFFVEKTVELELTDRGYEKEKRPGKKPDFFLFYRAHAEEKLDPTVVPYSCGEVICGQSLDIKTIREGTLVLDIIDAESNRVVWRGTAVSVLSDPSNRQEMISEAVYRMLRNFPP